MSKNTAAAVVAFNKVLNQPKVQRTSRTPTDVSENIKKLRRLILVEGIPSEAVRSKAIIVKGRTFKLHG